MQSTTTGASNPYDSCMHSVGEWAQTYPNLTQEQRTTAVNAYNQINGIFLQTRSLTAVPAAQPQAPRTPRQRGQGAQQSAGAQQKAAEPAAKTPTPRARNRDGGSDVMVLSLINANPGITTENLRKRPQLRDTKSNIVGTSLSRLLKTGRITGTAKVGPFTVTPPGVEFLQKNPVSINAARANRQRRRATTTTTTSEQPTAAAAAG